MLGRWALLGGLWAVYLSAVCFLVPLTAAVRPQAPARTLVSPRGGGDGVVLRRLSHGLSLVHVIDADLRTPGVSVRVQARNATRRPWGCSVGDALSLEEWCRSTGALAGINGGFFGAEVTPGRKEVIGLLKVSGTTFARAPLYRSRGPRRVTYAHSTFGIQDGRKPHFDWVVSDRRSMSRLLSYPEPENLRLGRRWAPDCALSGGPRLIHNGRPLVAAKHERLASPGPQPRTFLGYSQSREAGGNRLLLCTAAAMTYDDAAEFLIRYFHDRYGARCDEGMCLDGGSSSQLTYRAGKEIATVQGAPVTVPTCILLFDDNHSRATRPPSFAMSCNSRQSSPVRGRLIASRGR